MKKSLRSAVMTSLVMLVLVLLLYALQNQTNRAIPDVRVRIIILASVFVLIFTLSKRYLIPLYPKRWQMLLAQLSSLLLFGGMVYSASKANGDLFGIDLVLGAWGLMSVTMLLVKR